MRQLSSVELDLVVGGYGETESGGFDESVYEPRATLMEDGSYSLEVTEAEYQAHHAAAEADSWCIEVEGWVGGTYIRVKCSDQSSNAC
jgi:hypothetical protein